MATARQMFEVLDANKSGFIEEDELAVGLIDMGLISQDTQQQQMALILERMDEDGDGKISFEDFSSAAIAMGFLAPDSDPGSEAVDTLEAGSVSSDELPMNVARAMVAGGSAGTVGTMPDANDTTVHIPFAKRQLMWELFSAADDDHSGTIGCSELKALLQDRSLLGRSVRAGDQTSKAHVDKVMRIVDPDGSGSLDFDEFCLAFEGLFDEVGRQRVSVLVGLETLLNQMQELILSRNLCTFLYIQARVCHLCSCVFSVNSLTRYCLTRFPHIRSLLKYLCFVKSWKRFGRKRKQPNQ
eukprot:m.84535 g.84535  ORF g.84535 m.84535 type:complete len:298 (-) comp12749_c0_seq11:9-902(-)